MGTNLQLLLSIGIPSLLVVLSWINNNHRFTAIEKRLDDHDRRFVALENRMESRFNEILMANHKDALEIMRAMTALHERVAVLETRQTLQQQS